MATSEKQKFWINKIVSERDDLPEGLLALVEQAQTNGKVAHDLLSALFALPKPKKVYDTPLVVAECGYYLVGLDDVYVVVESKKNPGSRYAKKLVLPPAGSKRHAKWEYANGMVGKLGNAILMTLAEAAQFGHLHGYCCSCGAPLTVPAHANAGIGPDCAKKPQFAGMLVSA